MKLLEKFIVGIGLYLAFSTEDKVAEIGKMNAFRFIPVFKSLKPVRYNLGFTQKKSGTYIIKEGFDLPFLSLSGKKQAVANAVPLPMGGYLAELIKETIYQQQAEPIKKIKHRHCNCGCGRIVTGRALYSSATCRKRAQRQRENLECRQN